MRLIGCRIAAAAAVVILLLFAGWLGSCLYPWKWAWVLMAGSAVLWIGIAASAWKRCENKSWFRQNGGYERLAKEECRIWMVWLGSLVSTLAMGVAIGSLAGNQYLIMTVSFAVGVLIAEPLFCFLLCWPSSAQPHSRKNELDEYSFPLMHELLREEMKKAGHQRRVRIFLGDGGASAFIEPAYDGIVISPLFLTVLTKAELRQVFRHELVHLACGEVRRELRWRRLEARAIHVRLSMRNKIRLLAAAPLMAVSERFSSDLRMYLKRTEPCRESEADAYAASLEEARHAVAAIVKAEFVDRFLTENEFLPRSMKEICRSYNETVAKNGMMWLEELEHAPGDENDPHSDFRDRKMRLGVRIPNPFERETDTAWLRETDRVYELTDKIMNPR